MDSPPASLESQRSQRDFSFNFLLSSAKKQRDVNKGRKLKTHALQAIGSPTIFTPSRIRNFLRLGRIVFYVCRPLNGKHKTNILCALCGSAVNKILNLIRKCLNNYCRISKCIGIYAIKRIVTYFSKACPVIGTNSTPVICRVT
jgi:hypothetical protein